MVPPMTIIGQNSQLPVFEGHVTDTRPPPSNGNRQVNKPRADNQKERIPSGAEPSGSVRDTDMVRMKNIDPSELRAAGAP